MATLARTSWVGLLLARMPRPLLAPLDAWSHRVAQRRAQRRRALILQRQAASRT